MFGRVLLFAGLLAISAHAQFCDLIGDQVWAQDSGVGLRGTFLGVVSASTTDPLSIINPVGTYGSSLSSQSINNTLGNFGSSLASYSAYNRLSSAPPVILEYHAATNSYSLVSYLTTSTTQAGNRIHPDDLKAVLRYGGCAGCTPKVVFDTVRISIHDTVQISRTDTLRLRDTLKVAVHDTVTNCPAAIRGWSRNRERGPMPAFTIAGRALGVCQE